MTPLGWIIDYLLITGFGWGLYLLWLIPFQLFWVKLDKKQFIKWLRDGTILEMVFTYPIAKAIIFVGPMITKFAEVI